MADLGQALLDLIRAGAVESLRVEAVLKPAAPAPSPEAVPVVTLTVGPPRPKD